MTKKICKCSEEFDLQQTLTYFNPKESIVCNDSLVNLKKVVGSFVTDSDFSNLHELSERISAVYSYLGYDGRGKKVFNCGTYLEIAVNTSDYSDISVAKANFCKDRLCPQCNKRRSLKIYGQLSNILDHFPSGYGFLLCTLTIRNVSFNSLSDGIDCLISGWRKLMHSSKGKQFQKICKGSFRTLEITFNSDTGMWHPHIHVIVAVLDTYFNCRDYLSTSDLSCIWRDCAGLDYDPVVDMRRVKSCESGGVREVSKYCVKSNDLLVDDFDESSRRVAVLYRALRRRRLCGMTGLFKQLHHDLNLSDPEDDIVSDVPSTVNSVTSYLIVRLHWGAGAYHFELD